MASVTLRGLPVWSLPRRLPVVPVRVRVPMPCASQRIVAAFDETAGRERLEEPWRRRKSQGKRNGNGESHNRIRIRIRYSGLQDVLVVQVSVRGLGIDFCPSRRMENRTRFVRSCAVLVLPARDQKPEPQSSSVDVDVHRQRSMLSH